MIFTAVLLWAKEWKNEQGHNAASSYCKLSVMTLETFLEYFETYKK